MRVAYNITMAKSKKKTITIKSSETRITFGIIIFLIGLALILAPIFNNAEIFEIVTSYLGYSAIGWGVTLLYIALFFITDRKPFKSAKFAIALFVISLITMIFLTFWIPAEILETGTDFSQAGGIFGMEIHKHLVDLLGPILEFVILILGYIVGFSLASGITISQIRDYFAGADLPEENPDGTITKDYKGIKINMGINPENDAKHPEINVKDASKSMIDTSEKDGRDEPQFIGGSKNKDLAINDNSQSNTSANREGDDADHQLGEPHYQNWRYPPISLLKDPVFKPQNPELHKKNAEVIERTLQSFGIQSQVTNIAIGPTVVQYALSITVGTKVSKIKNLANDLAVSLATPSSSVRIEAPIPGTSLIGIEIPNPTPNFVYQKELAKVLTDTKSKYELPLIFGKSVSGQNIIKDLTELPHLLVAGATGTGKSVGINSVIVGLLMTKSPDELRLILVDPKMVEMSPYNGIPHLLTPVITDMELVVNALQWAIEEMLRRYRMLKQVGVRKIKEYNQKMGYNAMPYIVIIIDEMADLMLSTGVDVESKIVRLAQMSRAVGIHLILATQRPSVDVITGLIKANVPGRMSFSVATAIDSRVVIDQTGSETLIGKGDMLFKSPEFPRPIRIQGAWTDNKDIENVIDFIKEQTEEVYYFDDVTKPKVEEGKESASSNDDFSDDSMFEDALQVVINAQKASASLLQRKLRIGYNRAARLIDELEEAGAIGPQDGSTPRKVLVSSVDQIIASKTNTSSNSSQQGSFESVSQNNIENNDGNNERAYRQEIDEDKRFPTIDISKKSSGSGSSGIDINAFDDSGINDNEQQF